MPTWTILCPSRGAGKGRGRTRCQQVRDGESQPLTPALAHRGSALLEPLELPVYGIEIECLGIEVLPDPLGHLFVLFVFRVAQHREQAHVAPRPAAVLGRAGAFAGETGRVALAFLGRKNLLDLHLVLPAVAEVVFVDQLVAFADELIETGRALVLEHVGKFSAGDAVLLHTQPEGVHVAVGPAHGNLKNLVQLAELDVGRDLDAPPRGRMDVSQRDLDLIDVHGRRLAVKRRMRCADNRTRRFSRRSAARDARAGAETASPGAWGNSAARRAPAG